MMLQRVSYACMCVFPPLKFSINLLIFTFDINIMT